MTVTVDSGAGCLRILPLGDSNTRGKFGYSYRPYLRRLLLQQGIAMRFVGVTGEWQGEYGTGMRGYLTAGDGSLDGLHAGFGGYRIADFLPRVFPSARTDVRLALACEPDIVLLMLGTNDINAPLGAPEAHHGREAVGGRLVWTDPQRHHSSPVELLERLELLIGEIHDWAGATRKQEPCKVLVGTIPPMNYRRDIWDEGDPPRTEQDVRSPVKDEFNRLIRQRFQDWAGLVDGIVDIHEATLAGLSLADCFQAGTGEGHDGFDHLHFDSRGYEIMAHAWFAAIVRLLALEGEAAETVSRSAERANTFYQGA